MEFKTNRHGRFDSAVFDKTLTRTELKHSALGVVVHSGLGRAVSGATADLGSSVQVSLADDLDVQHLNSVRAWRLPHLVGGLFKLNGGS